MTTTFIPSTAPAGYQRVIEHALRTDADCLALAEQECEAVTAEYSPRDRCWKLLCAGIGTYVSARRRSEAMAHAEGIRARRIAEKHAAYRNTSSAIRAWLLLTAPRTGLWRYGIADYGRSAYIAAEHVDADDSLRARLAAVAE